MVASLPIIGGFPADTDRPDIPRGVRRVRGNAAPEKRTRIRSVDGSRSQSAGQLFHTDMWGYLDEVRLPLMEMSCSKE